MNDLFPALFTNLICLREKIEIYGAAVANLKRQGRISCQVESIGEWLPAKV